MLFHAEGHRTISKQPFGSWPYFGKQIRVPVCIECFFILPVRIGNENTRVIMVLQKCEVAAAGKIPDGLFIFVKKVQEFLNFILVKGHSDYPDQHI
jgi:hypothetical protein